MIRLLNAESHELPSEAELKRQQGCPYVILSHVWQETEVTFEDMPYFEDMSTSPSGPKFSSASKIIGACKAILHDCKRGITHLRLDTICIDKMKLTDSPRQSIQCGNGTSKPMSASRFWKIY